MEERSVHSFLGMLGMAEPTKRTMAKVRERIAEGKCLISECDCKPETRGLCNKHYQSFRRSFDGHSLQDRFKFEANCIANGLILSNQAIRAIRCPSPFAAVSEVSHARTS